MSKKNKNLRRISVTVTAQTLNNLKRLAALSGYNNIGMIIDKLTREKMISLNDEIYHNPYIRRYYEN